MSRLDPGLIVERLPWPILILDPSDRIVGANLRAQEMLGCSDEELRGRAIIRIDPDAGSTIPQESKQAQGQDGQLCPWLGRLDRSDFPELVLRIAPFFVADQDSPETALIAASVEPINVIPTDDHPESRIIADTPPDKLRTILDALPVGLLVAEGMEGRITLMNARAEALACDLRGEEEPKVPEKLADLATIYRLNGTPYELPDRPLSRTLQSGEPVTETVVVHRSEGVEELYEVATSPLVGPEPAAIAVYRNVTEEHTLRSDVAERAAQLKALLDNLPVGVAYFDQHSVCRAANGSARKLVAWPGSSLVGVTADELFGRVPALKDALSSCLKDRLTVNEVGIPWLHVSGSYPVRYLDWRIQPLPVVSGRSPGALVLIIDVTERKLIADRLHQTAKDAEETSRYKTRFLTAVSHDLRTPVNAIGLQAEWLSIIAERQSPPDTELLQLSADIRKSTSNLIELVNDLLELTLFDAGVMEYQPSSFALDEWLETTLTPMKAHARNKGLILLWSTDKPGRCVHADRAKLSRVLVNLVGNAIKFSEQGSVIVRAGATPEGGLSFSVRDTGPGIPSDQLERIFDEFAQLRNPERDRTKGTGLGLAICRRLVDGVGGKLVVESRVGHGSVFTANYPPDHLIDHMDCPETPASLQPKAPVTRVVESKGNQTEILLIEDDPFSQRSLVRLLEREGFRVHAIDDGIRAVRFIEQKLPDLVLLDLMLPGMEGAEVLRRVRRIADREQLPVVLLTGDVLSGRSTELRALDVNGLIAKPVDFEELLTLIRQCLMLPSQG